MAPLTLSVMEVAGMFSTPFGMSTVQPLGPVMVMLLNALPVIGATGVMSQSAT